jgi:hypothetical protein
MLYKELNVALEDFRKEIEGREVASIEVEPIKNEGFLVTAKDQAGRIVAGQGVGRITMIPQLLDRLFNRELDFIRLVRGIERMPPLFVDRG